MTIFLLLPLVYILFEVLRNSIFHLLHELVDVKDSSIFGKLRLHCKFTVANYWHKDKKK